MLHKIFSSFKIMAAIAILNSSIVIAQPFSKRINGISLKERTHQTLIPFDYKNYKRVGSLSKEIFIRIRQLQKEKSNSFKFSEMSFFKKQKRHSASINYVSQYTPVKYTASSFLKNKRHQ